jgi:hypothetical protein
MFAAIRAIHFWDVRLIKWQVTRFKMSTIKKAMGSRGSNANQPLHSRRSNNISKHDLNGCKCSQRSGLFISETRGLENGSVALLELKRSAGCQVTAKLWVLTEEVLTDPLLAKRFCDPSASANCLSPEFDHVVREMNADAFQKHPFQRVVALAP